MCCGAVVGGVDLDGFKGRHKDFQGHCLAALLVIRLWLWWMHGYYDEYGWK